MARRLFGKALSSADCAIHFGRNLPRAGYAATHGLPSGQRVSRQVGLAKRNATWRGPAGAGVPPLRSGFFRPWKKGGAKARADVMMTHQES